MTEKQEEKASDKILKAIGELSELLKTSHKAPEPEPKAAHQTIEDQLACPDCYPKIRDAVVKKEGFQKPLGKRDRHEYPLMCKECGLRTKKGETCPNCGSTETY